MCGIVGYIGDCATKNVIEGLKSLEYRGYDSAGVALIRDGYAPFVIKSEGRVSALEMKVGCQGKDFPVVIGHTRWATHGKPSDLNAHPHVAGNIAIVHNGIIENYLDLRDLLSSKCDRTTVTETDSEVIALLVEVSVGNCLFDKVRRAVQKLEGAYAIAVVSGDEPDTIIVARKKSPLVVGVFEGGAIVASDIHAVLPYTDTIHVLDDDEVAIVKKNHISIRKDNGTNNVEEIIREPLIIPWSVSSVSRGEFKTFMDKEIHEQPIAIYDTMIKNSWDLISKEIAKLFKENRISNIILTACGTSLHACMVGAMMLEGISLIRSSAKLASELEASGTMVNSRDLLIAISQSGETYDTIQAIKYAKEKGAAILAIVNTMGSSVEREADFTIHMAAGPEISVASTKAFVSQLAVLSMVAVAIRGISWGSWHASNMFVSAQNELYNCADNMDKIFAQEPKIKEIAKSISTAKTMLYLGKGLNVPVAFEGALKMKEVSYIHAEGFPAGEMRHGSIALVENQTPIIVVATNGQTYSKIMTHIEESKSRGAKIIAIATEGNSEITELVDHVIFVPDVGELFVPIMTVVPLQLLALYVTEELGLDPDYPRNLAKSCTV